jgi:hypothetical protein
MQRARGPIQCSLAALACVALATPSASADTPRYHHGLYVRVAGGLGYFSDSVDSDPLMFGTTAEGTITAAAIHAQFAVGGSLMPGLVLGGAVFVNHMPSPRTTNGVTHTGGAEFAVPPIDFDPTTLTIVGPFGDYYFDPASGFHVQAILGYGILSLGQGKGGLPQVPIRDQTGGGFAAGLGAGYEWWVSPSWGVGVLGNLMFGIGSGEDTGGNTWRHKVLIPGLLLSATMN